jgi:hypothetical protein
MIIDHIVSYGILEPKTLNEFPFNSKGNISEVFEGKIDVAKEIIDVINGVNH